MILDKNTFGKNPAEIELARVLSEINNHALTRHITRTLTKVSQTTKSLKSTPSRVNPNDLDVPGYLYKILRKHHLDVISTTKIIIDNKEVESYFKNCVVIRLKSLLK